ncbi:ankyrin repeat-containing protein [Stemphylium lycopersici]|uniref:Uncharacterized protein n=1 Tax=Stemphylium lycopersici TaxID=183478 RepID=A0A364NDL4_STELY|nr:ankyrin repeat-containing protein [Stemphylium lycopersici]RAR15370.1 hypothetical protein DDE83_001199 [Stemphylium lycopersici]
MAEPVSSIITIATVTLAAIKECTNYIESLRSVDKSVERLLNEISRLRRIVCIIQDTYRKARPEESDEKSMLVRERIEQCRDRLREIRPKAIDLGSRDSETFVEKTMLKLKYDEVAKDIAFATKDIKNHMEEINQVFNCWGLEAMQSIRRISEASKSQSSDSANTMTDHRVQQRSLSSPPVTSLFDAENSKDGYFLAMSFVDSFGKSDMCLPLSSTSPVFPYNITNPPKQNIDWEDFHAKLRKCRDNTSGVREIRLLLRQAQDQAELANVRGYCQRVPLHIAAQLGFGQVARVLLEFGANIDAKDEKQLSVLDHAVENNQREFVAILLENGVDETAINKENKVRFRNMNNVISFRNRRRQ